MPTSRPHPVPRRVALLIAALLHLLGVAAGPALHGWNESDPHLPGWSHDRGDAVTVAHDDALCVICQANGPAIAEPPQAPLSAASPHDAPAPAPASLHDTPALVRVRARAPPVSLA